MPMCYDLTRTKRPRTLFWPHLELVTSFFEAVIRRNDYFQREVPDLNELAGEDLTREVVYAWAQVRGWLAKNAAHIHFAHRDGLTNDHDHKDKPVATLSSSKNGGEMKSMGHGHMIPPLFALADVIKDDEVRQDAFDRARRDLEGLVGMRTAAARGKFDPKEVFSDEFD